MELPLDLNYVWLWGQEQPFKEIRLRKFQISMVALVATLVSCASSTMPKASYVRHPDDRGVPAIDDVIVEMKGEYIKDCYGPVVNRQVPETRCQTDLFQLLERRYHLNYKQEHVDMASDDLFFRNVDQRIRTMVRTDPEVRQAVKANFRSHEELLAYYKSLYGFNPITSQN